nr:hypothetical protein [Acidimangrovimonas sediminis]
MPADLDHVAKAGGRQQGTFRATPFEDRVGGDGRTVKDVADILRGKPCLIQDAAPPR